MALLIAVPWCCCSAEAKEAPGARPCCVEKAHSQDSGKQEKSPCPCACKAKEPSDEVKNPTLPVAAVLPFVPVVPDLSWLVPPSPVDLPVLAGSPYTGSDPPRLLLARYSRWLN
ncbi:hypothetical protein WKV53_20185 [Luteolibacter sp. Y139]|uniref:Secreted protein n=2 Tax=Luteolibacter soli TaxID=3135280 RepID=A0ABU9AYJ5_9BACT